MFRLDVCSFSFSLQYRPEPVLFVYLSTSSSTNDEKREWSAEPGFYLVPTLPLRGNMDQYPGNRAVQEPPSPDAAYKSAAENTVCIPHTQTVVQHPQSSS